ncbi:hypothetical protein E2C01_003399 [Portunus trituberculatus]|uniref:Uncharacterized protein n=1 Tax=Portunus trituberculatus TaxID=210409 RepID=A0A5B7CMQ5_PORTR|nr:hypothetical protein [Portunus trituberculatus]
MLNRLAYETVAQIVDLALLVKRDATGHNSDLSRFRTPTAFNPDYPSVFIHQSGSLQEIGTGDEHCIGMDPITPSEVREAMRRYWANNSVLAPFSKIRSPIALPLPPPPPPPPPPHHILTGPTLPHHLTTITNPNIAPVQVKLLILTTITLATPPHHHLHHHHHHHAPRLQAENENSLASAAVERGRVAAPPPAVSGGRVEAWFPLSAAKWFVKIPQIDTSGRWHWGWHHAGQVAQAETQTSLAPVARSDAPRGTRKKCLPGAAATLLFDSCPDLVMQLFLVDFLRPTRTRSFDSAGFRKQGIFCLLTPPRIRKFFSVLLRLFRNPSAAFF